MSPTASHSTFTGAEAAELAVVERSGFIESRHLGSAIVLGPDGAVARALGNPDAPIFPRSSMKPFQAVAIMGAGVPLDGASAVLATASHAGTPAHLSVVRGLLAQAQLPEASLRCPRDWPLDSGSRDALIRTGETKRPLFMNCSGKHAAMLLACAANGWATDTYLDAHHPLQVHIRETIERLIGEKVVATGVDGCGAPVYAMSLAALARGIQRIATASDGSPFALYRNAAILKNAVLANGWAIDGPGRPNTVVIDRLGVFTKGGAEGVMVMAAPDGTTVALKVLDGSLRAATIVALELLVDAGALARADVDAVAPELDLAVLGRGEPVGTIRASYAA